MEVAGKVGVLHVVEEGEGYRDSARWSTASKNKVTYRYQK